MDPEVLRLVLEGECPHAALEWLWITEKHLTALIAPLVFTLWKGQVSLSLYYIYPLNAKIKRAG